MQLWELLIPQKMGDTNCLIHKKHHKKWDKYVRKLSGGLTILHLKAKGQWIEPISKELVEERMISVRIACSEKDILKIIDFTIDHYKQKSVMAYQVSTKVLLINKKED